MDEEKELVVSKKLKQLNIKLPKAPDPVGAYVAFKKISNLLYISGQLPIKADGEIIKGKIGKNLTLKDGQEASKLCVINICNLVDCTIFFLSLFYCFFTIIYLFVIVE